MADKQTPGSTSVSAGSTQGQLVLALLLGVTLAAVFVKTRVPTGTIPRWLATHPRELLLAAALLILAMLPFAGTDYLKARKRSYAPPSLRVQVARALAYGAALGGANVLVLLGSRPELVSSLANLGSAAGALGILAIPYGIACWYGCLRAREFIPAPMPAYREVAAALLDTNDFVIGRAGSSWKDGTGDASWLAIPELGMCANIYTLGGIGSGKTSSVAKIILDQAIFKWPGAPERRNGIFLLDAKGNMAEWIADRARRAGREKDVVILTPGGSCSYNPIAYGSPSAIAQKLVAALEVMTDQDGNSYYQKMQREFAENALQVLTDVLGPGRVSMMTLYDFITDQVVQRKFLEAAAASNSISFRWFKNQWAREDPREQMMLTKGFRADLSSFVRDEIAPTFANAAPTFPGWECLLDEGKIVVFSMSLDEYGPFARALGIFVLMDFQSVMLARTTPRFRAGGHNRDRLIVCALDEVWAYMNPKLAEFTSVSREAKCCSLALHQSLGQVPEKYRQVVLGNFRTPIILAVNDLLTLSTFTQLFGTHKVLRRSISESSGYSGVERQLLRDHLSARVGGESKTISSSLTEVDEPRFSTDEILHLKKNRAVIQMFDGDDTHTPRVIETLPHFKPEHQLG